MAIEVDQRTAGVAAVDRRVGLDEVLVAALGESTAPAQRAHDARGHRLAQIERIADGDHEIADREFVGVAERQRFEVVGVDLQQRDVGLRVAADQFGLELAPVLQLDDDLLGIVDDVVVGHHVPLRRIDNHARPGAYRLPRRVAVRKEPPEERIVVQRVAGLGAQGADAHDRRGHVFEHRRERQSTVVGGRRCRQGGTERHDEQGESGFEALHLISL